MREKRPSRTCPNPKAADSQIVVVEPTLEVERSLLPDAVGREELPAVAVIGLDEVGRGAIAGPVMVGAFALVFSLADAVWVPPALPLGIRDSKLVSAKKREVLFEDLSAPGWMSAVGAASAFEIDERGIVPALRLAAFRAWEGVRLQLEEAGVKAVAGILDGNLDYLSPARMGQAQVPIHVRVKGDQRCVSVAAASILAKVTRDRHMVALSKVSPQYGWESNKGYGSAAHKRALAQHGLHPEHRSTWNLLPGPSLDVRL